MKEIKMKEEDSVGFKTPSKITFFHPDQLSLEISPITNFQSPMPDPSHLNGEISPSKNPNRFSRLSIEALLVSPNSTLNETSDKRKENLRETSSSNPYSAVVDEHEMDLGKDGPSLKWCAFCARESVSNKHMKSNSTTFWSAVAIFFMGGFLGCFLLPYATNTCKTVEFRCAQCNHAILN